ncbi:MAG: flagellar motor protein MotB [Candidatus Liberibacter ctenarytainae]|uniref:Flagellar motor protein MotB n=1 Tax=Candidatus Liberibacter ctenarytainae TaxID=2020335 RepID=A0A937ADU1_9HYPH|nr:flagellar motor protein MotB [Candidatus Liberibacter ctenarytainae]
MNDQEDNQNKKVKVIIVKKKFFLDNSKNRHTWKIVYADFMTALMSFFLLMWIVNSSDDGMKMAIESYFNPFGISNLSANPRGIHDLQHLPVEAPMNKKTEDNSLEKKNDRSLKDKDGKYDISRFNHLEDNNVINSVIPDTRQKKESYSSIIGDDSFGKNINNSLLQKMEVSQDEIQKNPEKTRENPLYTHLSEESILQFKAKKHVQKIQNQIRDKLSGLVEEHIIQGILVRHTKKGTLISIFDGGDSAVFDRGSSVPIQKMVLIIQKIGEILSRSNEEISIQGHADARPFHASIGDNWKLSLDRAYSAYQILIKSGIDEKRISEISGFSNHHLKNSSDPLNRVNRRIEILIHDQKG